MLSEEQIKELWEMGCKDKLTQRALVLVRAIEGDELADKLFSLFAAAPKPAQTEPSAIEKMYRKFSAEIAQRNINDLTAEEQTKVNKALDADDMAQEGVPFKATIIFDDCTKTVEGVMAVQAEKQEPVARVDANDDGYWAEILPDRSVKVGQLLYTRPQPDLTAEVERLRAAHEFNFRRWQQQEDRIAELEALVSTREDDIRTEKMWVQRHAERIAELEEAAREARELLQYDLNVNEAIAKLDAVLGNA